LRFVICLFRAKMCLCYDYFRFASTLPFLRGIWLIAWIIFFFCFLNCLHCFKFYFYSLAVEMLFFSLYACPQGVNFAGSGIPRSIVSLGGSFIFDNVHHASKFGLQCSRFVCATS
jgi:hypothetical protein